jgi:hypothetical protein
MWALSKTETNTCSICKTPIQNVTKRHIKVLNRYAVAITALLAASAIALAAISVAFFVHASFLQGPSVATLHLAASIFLFVSLASGASVALLCKKTNFWHDAVRVDIEWV